MPRTGTNLFQACGLATTLTKPRVNHVKLTWERAHEGSGDSWGDFLKNHFLGSAERGTDTALGAPQRRMGAGLGKHCGLKGETVK